MKKLHILGLAALSTLVACNDKDYLSPEQLDADRDNQYTQTWIKKFDVPAPTQDWCMLTPIEAKVRVAGDNASNVNIYSKSPALGGKLLAVSGAEGSVWFDVMEGSSSVYAQVVNEMGEVVSGGTYTVADNKVDIDGTATDTDKPESRYAHDATYGNSWFNSMIVCEDLGSAENSDFDFNDIVIGLHFVAGTNALQIVPMAAGGTIPADLKITIGDETHSMGEIHELLKPGAKTTEMINTRKPFNKAGTVLTYTSLPYGWTIAKAWQNHEITLTVENHGVAYDIKTPDVGTAPKMICLGGDWYWPVETKPIDVAYPGFTQWAKDGHNDAGLTAWVDNYASLDLVVDWDISKVADNWFSATTKQGSYDAKINNSKTVNVPTGVRHYMDVPITTAYMFKNCTDIETIDITGDHFNTAAVGSTYAMFENAEKLTTIDLSGWNTSNLTNIYYMFANSGVKTLTLDGWDLSHIPDEPWGFASGYGNNQGPLKGTSLETLNINNAKLNVMFYTYSGSGNDKNCGILCDAEGTLKTVNAEGCTFYGESTRRMFADCQALTSINLKGWSFPEATSLSQMFIGCSALKSLDLDNWDVSKVSSMTSLFANCTQIKDISMKNWNTESLTNSSGMFNGCSNITSLDLTGWNTDNLTAFDNMFSNTGITDLKLNNWNFSNIPREPYGFSNAWGSHLHDPFLNSPIEKLTIENCKLGPIFYTYSGSGNNIDYGLMDCLKSTMKQLNTKDCELCNMTSASRMFYECAALDSVDVRNWNFGDVTSLSEMFRGCSSLNYLLLDTWNMDQITSMYYAFANCTNLKQVFMNGWDTSALVDASGMFSGCAGLTKLDLSGWNTASLKYINNMFDGAGIKELTLNGWDFSKIVKPKGSYGFSNAWGSHAYDPFLNTSIEVLNIENANLGEVFYTYTGGGYNTNYGIVDCLGNSMTRLNAKGCVLPTNSAYNMLAGCKALVNVDLSGWRNTSAITSVESMFAYCSSLQSINFTGWDLSGVTSWSSMFSNCPSTLEITCSPALRDLLISRASSNALPTPLRDASSSQWHIVN